MKAQTVGRMKIFKFCNVFIKFMGLTKRVKNEEKGT